MAVVPYYYRFFIEKEPSLRSHTDTCRYRGYGIPDSVCMDLSIPCVSVCCRATKSQLVLTGCPAPKGLPSDNGHPFWPGCCTQPSPEPPVTLLERSLSPEAERHTFMSAYQYRKFQ
ncbi:uncharacterized protein LOC142590384 [Dermacentor variabilis]|uniref:uncharacterized protein LOC142590384 n=1 Tax=Dermacentor variabilis TaxID=34621 RepID=UPI003F5C3040